MPWQILAHPSHQAKALGIPPEALAAAPVEVLNGQGPVLLPRAPFVGRCRLCGREDELTKEHVPTRASGNKQRTVKHTVEEWAARRAPGDLAGGLIEQGGVAGYTLCEPCNNRTGLMYGTEYKRWTQQAWYILSQLPHPRDLDGRLGYTQTEVRFGNVDPGAFIRQVLSFMCTLSGPWDLSGRHRQIRSIILDGVTDSLPNGLGLVMSFYLGPSIRLIGPSFMVDLDSGQWQWVLEMAYPPFAFAMTLSGTKEEPYPGLSIAPMTMVAPGERGHIDGVVDVTFGHTPVPGDYRSLAMIESER